MEIECEYGYPIPSPLTPLSILRKFHTLLVARPEIARPGTLCWRILIPCKVRDLQKTPQPARAASDIGHQSESKVVASIPGQRYALRPQLRVALFKRKRPGGPFAHCVVWTVISEQPACLLRQLCLWAHSGPGCFLDSFGAGWVLSCTLTRLCLPGHKTLWKS